MAKQENTTQRPNGRFPITRFEVLLGILGLAAIIVAALLLFSLLSGSRGTQPAISPTPMAQATLPLILPSAEPLITATTTGTAVATLPPTDTATPPPTAILPSATPACVYDMRFVTDVTIPDDSIIAPGVGFTKVWRVQNSGTCAWPNGSVWFFAAGHQMGGPNAVPVPSALPGQTVDIAVNLIAPTAPGQYTGFWSLRLPDGQVLDKRYYVRIIVPAPTATRAPATNTPNPTATAVASATPTNTPPPIILNWRGEYFPNTNLSGAPMLVRDDAAIQFNWGNGAPAPNLPADNFSARWTRNLNFEAGAYRFYARSDDGVRVWVNNQLIIDRWQTATGETHQADLVLPAGTHSLRVEYFEQTGIAQIQFWWARMENFTDWRGEYYANRSLSGLPTVIRNDREINFNWGQGAPAANLPADNFSVRWTRSLRFEEGSYRFRARVDDGMRFYINNNLVIDEWRDGSEREVSVDYWLATGVYDLRVEYYERTGAAQIAFWWERVSGFPDWRGEYWNNQHLQGAPVVTRNDREINFDWGFGSPAPQVPTDQFSARWTRQIDFSNGLYRFYARSDDGVRIFVDGALLLDRWQDSSGDRVHEVDVVLNGRRTIVVEYYDNLHTARIRVWYERLGDPPTPTALPPSATPTETQTPLPPTGTPLVIESAGQTGLLPQGTPPPAGQ